MFVDSRYTGTGVDLFIAQLRHYLSVLCLQKHDSDVLVLEQFLRSVPKDVGVEIRARCARDDSPLELNAVLNVARHMPSLANAEDLDFVGAAKATTIHGSGKGKGRRPAKGGPKEEPQSKGKCFLCEGEHRMRECPLVQTLLAAAAAGKASGPASPAVSTLGPQRA
jgi:hypothetical protein